MKDFLLLTDSSCDLPPELAQELGIEVLPLTVTVGSDSYKNYLDGREIGFHRFYERVLSGENAVTAAVNMDAFINFMRPIVEGGTDILYLGFSSGLSGTVNAGAMAAKELMSEIPGANIKVVDTKCASMGQGLCVYLTALQKKAGKSFEECYEYAEKTAPRCIHWFTVSDLFFLKRGGRVSATTAVVGTMLNIKPVLHVDDEGHLINMGKARGRKASIKAIFDNLREAADNHLKGQTVFISHGDCLDDAKYLESMLLEAGAEKVVISYVGPVIGAHSGPGTLAVFALGDKR